MVGTVRMTVQGPVPLPPPLQPANTEPPLALALGVTVVPAGKFAEKMTHEAPSKQPPAQP